MHPDHLVGTLNAALAYPQVRGQFLAHFGLGFASLLVAEAIDLLEPAPYAAYYVGAVNAAISPKYWDFLAVISLLLLCLLFPVLLLRTRLGCLNGLALALLPVVRQVLSFTFALGTVSAGILSALLLMGRLDSPVLLAWRELLFGSHPLIVVLSVLLCNGLLGGAGQIVAHPPEHPVWQRLMTIPGRYVWPAYGLFVALALGLLLGQQ